ncbi:glycosyltransferase family 39 protein [Streptomyces violaceusniger]|uniref:glycosyltransferase family 39 protein n=1 Tax=Streptomyces violaceusniger TaxID=68280 RepID=UPI001F2B5362|nr:glycosyltransferase family 39 protein [Streptomyces hygroscopicus]
MAVMLGLGLWGLDRGTMWRDESATYQMARRTLPQIRDALGTVDAVHGLYYLLMHPLLALHPSEVTMRLPSVLAAVAATALVAALGCRLARPRVGLWAGLLYATTPVVTHYAQEGRSYALVAACAAWATYLLVGAAGLAVGAATGGVTGAAAGGAPGAATADRPAARPGPGAGGGAGAGPGAVSRAAGLAGAPGPAVGPAGAAGPAGEAASGPGAASADRPAAGRGAARADRPAVGPGAGAGPGAVTRAAGPAGEAAPGPAATPADRPAPGQAPMPGPGAGSRAAGEAGRAAPGRRVRSAVLVRGGVPRVARWAASAPGPERVASGAGWRWAAYGGVVAVTALLHVFAVLVLAAHALTLLVSRAPRRVWWGWGSAAAGALAAVVPLAVLARRQSGQIAWIRHPTPGRLWAVVEEFAGPSALVLALNLLLIAVAVVRPRWRSLTAVALPLFCVPPVLLFALALHRPCFHERYLLFALAGIPLLAAAGVDRLAGAGADWLARVVAARRVEVEADRSAGAVADRLARAVVGRLARAVEPPARVVAARRTRVRVDRRSGAVAGRLARVVARCRADVRVDRLAGVVTDRRRAVVGRRRAVVVAAGVLVVGCGFVWQLPLHQREREPLSRQDNLAALAAAVGRLTRPGEPVLYDPPKERRIAIAYPRPLAGLRDIALGAPGPASGTLYGVDVGRAELLRRLGGARSAWVIAADEPETRRAKATVLTGRFQLAYSLCLPGIRLEHYVRAGPAR